MPSKLDKKSLNFLFVGICQLKVPPVQLYASNLKCEDLVIFYYIILVYKLFILKKLFVSRKFVLLGWQNKSKLKEYINFKKIYTKWIPLIEKG